MWILLSLENANPLKSKLKQQQNKLPGITRTLSQQAAGPLYCPFWSSCSCEFGDRVSLCSSHWTRTNQDGPTLQASLFRPHSPECRVTNVYHNSSSKRMLGCTVYAFERCPKLFADAMAIFGYPCYITWLSALPPPWHPWCPWREPLKITPKILELKRVLHCFFNILMAGTDPRDLSMLNKFPILLHSQPEV